MRYTHIRNISEEEKRELYDLLDNNPDIKYRAKIVLLAGEEGYTVPEIREMTNIYDKTIRKWIHRFNGYGVKGIFTQMDYSGMIKITDKARNEILRISSTNPREIGLKFSTWSSKKIEPATILNPHGTTLKGELISSSQDIDTDPLPATGTYTVVVDPQSANTCT